MTLSYEQAWNAKPDGRGREEIFQSIVDRVKERSGHTLSDEQARTAARNLIALCRELMGLGQDEALGCVEILDTCSTFKTDKD